MLKAPPEPYLVVQRTQRIVARDGFFSFEGRRYAVPAKLARPGERVELVLGSEEVEVYSKKTGKRLACHQRGRPERILPDPERESVQLAEVLGALPLAEVEVHRRPLYEQLASFAGEVSRG